MCHQTSALGRCRRAGTRVRGGNGTSKPPGVVASTSDDGTVPGGHHVTSRTCGDATDGTGPGTAVLSTAACPDYDHGTIGDKAASCASVRFCLLWTTGR